MEPLYLFLDTETNSTSLDRLALQLAWIITDEDGNVLKKESHYLKRNIDINPISSKKNGITKETLEKYGEDPNMVINLFKQDLLTVQLIVGHQISFDLVVLRNEFNLYDLDIELLEIPSICTMRWSYDYVRVIDKNGNPKNPRLEETAGFLLFNDKDHQFDGLHEAMTDTELTMKCFFKLKELESKSIIPPYNFEQKVKRIKSSRTVVRSEIEEQSLDEVVFLSDEELEGLSKEDLFVNKNILVTGTISNLTRNEVKQLLTDLGALPQKSMVKSLDYIIIGEDFGPSKIADVIKRQKEGTPLRCLKAIQFYRMIQKFQD